MATPQLKRQIISIGKRKLTLDDFSQIVLNENVEIEINSAQIETLSADYAKFKRAAKNSASSDQQPISKEDVKYDTNEVLNPVEARAIMLVRINNFFQNFAHVQPDVVTFLTQLLNDYVAPILPAKIDNANEIDLNKLIMKVFVSIFDQEPTVECTQGLGLNAKKISLGEYCKGKGISIPVLGEHERSRFVLGCVPSQAIHVLNTSIARSLTRVADAAAGLSCEAAYIAGSTFTSDFYEFARPYATAVEAASILRWMVDSSANAEKGSGKGQSNRVPVSYRYIPSAHAALRDATAGAYNVARIDLNSGEPSGAGIPANVVLDFDDIQICQVGLSLKNATQEVMSYSLDRISKLLDGSELLVAPVLPPIVLSEKEETKLPTEDETKAAQDRAEVISSEIREVINKRVLILKQKYEALRDSTSKDPISVSPNLNTLQELLALETALALQIMGARDYQAITKSLIDNARTLQANRAKVGELQLELAALKAELDALSNAPEPPTDFEKKSKNLTKKISVLQIRIDNSNDISKLIPKGVVYGKGASAVRSILTPQYFPSEGLCESNVKTGMERLAVENSLSAVGTALTPLSSGWPKLSTELAQALTTANAVVQPKVPKGTRDTSPELMAIRERAFSTITEIFKRHGAVGIDTPVFERRDTLMGKYGEDTKLIYDLADQGGEILSLRYDLTVPFARYMATTGTTNIRRYHIAKVYRRDQPILSRGRFREFHQCDFDVAGAYPPMIPDAEVLKIMTEVLTKLDLGPFIIKLNHRKLLDAMMAVSGVPADKFRPICSAVDKLDKESWETVKNEMVHEKGLSEEAADKLGTFVTRPAAEAFEMLAQLEVDESINKHEMAKEALADMKLLFNYLKAMNGLTHISFDLSLARGLDYYTGIIYEAVLLSPNALGSIASGGRYDNLIGMFSGKQVPSIGISIGIERVMVLMEQREREKGRIRTNNIDVLVASVGEYLLERMALCDELWSQEIGAEFLYHEKPNLRKQMEHALSNDIPFVIWLGENELKDNVVTLKRYSASESKDQHEDAITVSREVLCKYLKKVIPLVKESPEAKLPAVEDVVSSDSL